MSHASPDVDVGALSIKEMRTLIAKAGLRHDDCLDKADLRQRTREAIASPPAGGGGGAAPASGATAGATLEPPTPDITRILSLEPHAFYTILSLRPDATAADLKKAYRALALRLHPDKCRSRGADEAFKRVSAAFAALSDPQERAAHDRSGGDAPARSGASRDGGGFGRHAAAGFHGRSGGMAFGDRDAEELFRAFFGSEDGGFGFGASPWSAAGGKPSNAGDAPAGSSVATFSAEALAARAAGALNVCQRLGRAFVHNPWVLVTLLSALASLVSIAESLYALLGSWLTLAVPAAALGLLACPPQRRKHLGMLLCIVLCSGCMV